MLRHLVCCLVSLLGTSHGADPPAALLVVGGGKSSVELVDLTDGGAESCISPVRALNFKRNAAEIWVDDNPTMCGGGDYYSYDYSDKCASYDMNEGKWAPYNILPETRLDNGQIWPRAKYFSDFQTKGLKEGKAMQEKFYTSAFGVKPEKALIPVFWAGRALLQF